MTPLIATIIAAAINIAVLVLVVLFVVWIFESIAGVAIPPRIKQLGAIIVALLCVLIILDALGVVATSPPLMLRWR